jgi:hypothetical protein
LKNCPVAWQQDFGNRNEEKSIILEAIVDESLHIWHIGFPNSNNDLNVLDSLPLVHGMVTSAACNIIFEVNGK